ncbi:hypothetical protein [Bartonella sp. HY761]|uniref:hypothetical protein n=1 Tax=Bartonella sp. HY761 TaxID=2979330 RepID=UPI00220F17DE|nr:hypothetical protein [Bartonella sp. HY761]UXN07508.1 hypothetical protein N6A79_05860 [Bartonella sp. HY761]
MSNQTFGYIEHFTKDGERFDALAFYYYEDVRLQNVLIDANIALFTHHQIPAILPAGLTLKIPLREKSVAVNDRLLPPWKQGVNL